LAWKSPFVGKITGHFSPTVPSFPARGLSRCWRRGAPGGASGNFQSSFRTIRLHGCCTSGGISLRCPTEEEEEEEEEEEVEDDEEEEDEEEEEEEDEEEEVTVFQWLLCIKYGGPRLAL
jgi:hypothetical protein